jgi:hypothetical protein
LNGCGSWSETFKEEYVLRTVEKRALGRIFGARREKVTGGWRELHREELYNLYSS